MIDIDRLLVVAGIVGTGCIVGCDRQETFAAPDYLVWDSAPIYIDGGHYHIWVDGSADSRKLHLAAKHQSDQTNDVRPPLVFIGEEEADQFHVTVGGMDASSTMTYFSELTGSVARFAVVQHLPDGSRRAAIDTDLDGVFDVRDQTNIDQELKE